MPETETPTTDPATAPEEVSSETDDTTDWKAKAREWEKRSKDNLARLKDAEPKLAEYNRLVEASKSELDLAREQASTFQERAEAAERAAMVNAIALEKNLTPALARRLQGSTREELEADADELQSLIPASPESRAPRVDLSQGSSSRGGTPGDPAQQFASIIRGQIGS